MTSLLLRLKERAHQPIGYEIYEEFVDKLFRTFFPNGPGSVCSGKGAGSAIDG